MHPAGGDEACGGDAERGDEGRCVRDVGVGEDGQRVDLVDDQVEGVLLAERH